jgi:hypothetical protein
MQTIKVAAPPPDRRQRLRLMRAALSSSNPGLIEAEFPIYFGL